MKHIIVTGHYDCGAVRASVQNQDLGLVENWLQNIRDVYRIREMRVVYVSQIFFFFLVLFATQSKRPFFRFRCSLFFAAFLCPDC